MSADSIGEVTASASRSCSASTASGIATSSAAITRVNPAANATTRQVEVLVTFDDAKQQPNVAGLYAEGRVETSRTAALTIPPSALVREGDSAFAWRLKDRAIHKVALKVGDRDPRTGEFVLKDGLAEGDTAAALSDRDPAERAVGRGRDGEEREGPGGGHRQRSGPHGRQVSATPRK